MTSVEIERKSLDAIVEDADTDKPHGGFTAVLSTPSLDRDGDVLSREEWMEPLPDRLPLDIDHNMTVEGTIGSFRPYFDDAGRLMMDATFASTPKAQEVRTLIKEGHISSVSVAFMTDRSKKDGTPRRELLNAGVVAIPSNRDAVILDSKAAKPDVAEAAEEVVTKASNGDSALIQAIHDAACHLGAACCVMDTDNDDEVAEGDTSGADDKPKPKSLKGLDLTVAVTLDQFKEALSEITDGFVKSSDSEETLAVVEPQGISPAESPVTDAADEAATSEDVPAESPAPVSADEAAESEVVLSSEVRARRMAMTILAQEVLSDDPNQ